MLLNSSNDNFFFGIFYFQSSMPRRGTYHKYHICSIDLFAHGNLFTLIVNIQPFNYTDCIQSFGPILFPRQTKEYYAIARESLTTKKNSMNLENRNGLR